LTFEAVIDVGQEAHTNDTSDVSHNHREVRPTWWSLQAKGDTARWRGHTSLKLRSRFQIYDAESEGVVGEQLTDVQIIKQRQQWEKYAYVSDQNKTPPTRVARDDTLV